MAPVTTLPSTPSPRSSGSFDQRITLQVPYLCQRDSVGRVPLSGVKPEARMP
jgi:hypothetical protein